MAKKISEILLCIWIASFSIGITKISFIPIKTIIFFAFVFFSSRALIGKGKVILKHPRSLFLLWLWVVIASTIGVSNGFDLSTINQDASLVASFLVVIFSFVLYENNLLNVDKIKSAIYLTAGVGVAIKVFLGLSVVSGLFSADSIDELMQNYAGSTSFNADIFGGFLGLLPRIGNAGDLFNLIVFVFVVKQSSGIRFIFFWVLVLAFTLVTYSRYLMLFFAIVSLYAAVSGIKERSKAATIAMAIVILSIALYYSDADVIYSEIENRFTGQVQLESDSIRAEMKTVLFNTFSNNPFVGIGLGGHVQDYIRSPTNLWQYELEYLSLLMQLGVLGFIAIVVNFIVYVIRVLFSNYQKAFIFPMLLSTAFWIGTPFQSSLFNGTQSALIILSIFFLSRKSENCLGRL